MTLKVIGAGIGRTGTGLRINRVTDDLDIGACGLLGKDHARRVGRARLLNGNGVLLPAFAKVVNRVRRVFEVRR